MDQMQQHADSGDAGGVPAASARAQQAAAGAGKQREYQPQQQQQHAELGYEGGMPAASARAQQAAALGKKQEQNQQPASSLNPTAARLLREAIVSQPDAGAATGSSDILAFARAVDRADSPLE